MKQCLPSSNTGHHHHSHTHSHMYTHPHWWYQKDVYNILRDKSSLINYIDMDLYRKNTFSELRKEVNIFRHTDYLWMVRLGCFIFFSLLFYILKYFKNVYLSGSYTTFFNKKKSYLEHNSLIVPPAESFHTQHLAPKIKLW